MVASSKVWSCLLFGLIVSLYGLERVYADEFHTQAGSEFLSLFFLKFHKVWRSFG